MVPVYYGPLGCSTDEEKNNGCKSSDTKAWRKANVLEYDGNDYDGDGVNESWYDYNSKQWANAVVVSQSLSYKQQYINAPPGTIIDNAQLQAYFVYIPRYRYRVQTLSYAGAPTAAQLYEIQFENKNLPGYARAKISGLKAVGDWLTHPAFTVDPDGYPTDDNENEIELNGFWMGKFELTGSVDVPTTMPNVASLAATVKNIWDASRNMQTNIGMDLTKHEIAPQNNYHWGATAQLAVSDYGKGLTEITANATNGTTGGSATANAYITANTAQSTTGNVTGVYDMVRGRWEYTLANFGIKGTGNLASSGFTPPADFPAVTPGLQRINIIPHTGPTSCGTDANFNVCVGQGLVEQKYWNATHGNNTQWDNNEFAASMSWLVRGGCFYGGSGTGGSLFSVEARVGSSAVVSCFYGSGYTTSPGGRVVESKITD
jgi:hypothetical protein